MGNLDPISERKLTVRKHSRAIQISGGVAVAVIAVGLLAHWGAALIITLVLIAAVVAGYNGWKISKIVNHKDQW